MHRCTVRKVCSHMMEGGPAHPISFGSQTLTPFFSVKLFHQYHNGRAFTWMTDHKPHESLFNQQIWPIKALARIQCQTLALAARKCAIENIAGSEQRQADALRRLPFLVTLQSTPAPTETMQTMELHSHWGSKISRQKQNLAKNFQTCSLSTAWLVRTTTD